MVPTDKSFSASATMVIDHITDHATTRRTSENSIHPALRNSVCAVPYWLYIIEVKSNVRGLCAIWGT